MRSPEDELIGIMKRAGVDIVSTLPCERVKVLLSMIGSEFIHIPVAREEEGVGISAGASLAGMRPAMIVQNSGIGNMINALLSLTSFYGLPLAIFLSHRGAYRENIAAQVPMGERVEGVLKAAGIGCTIIRSADELGKITRPLNRVYREGSVHAFLLSPKIWEGSKAELIAPKRPKREPVDMQDISTGMPERRLTRYRVLQAIKDYLQGKLVVCNLGFPSKELYNVIHQPSNFYMLGSMGMATPVGFGVSLGCKEEVVVIDGDGSILMNPATLSTIAVQRPANLTIILIDNGVYSSTGDQWTAASDVADLSFVARGFGLRNTYKVSKDHELNSALTDGRRGPRLIHVVAKKGNRKLPNIELSAEEIKNGFMSSVSVRS